MTKKITFTEEAIKEIDKIVLKNGSQSYFRVSVKGGGRQLCSGLLQKPYANLFKSQQHTEY